jgi:chemotaxis methyl-accepting protein methylase
MTPGTEVKLAILGCSKGAEVYSIVGALRLARSDLRYRVYGLDISEEILEFARQGVYALSEESPGSDGKSGATSESVRFQTGRDQRGLSIFDRVSPIEMEAMFENEGDRVRVKPWLKEGISWHCGNVEDPNLISVLGPEDVVVASRFLCHMKPADAERCLRALARLVKPGGYLFASGVDLDARARVAKEMGWEPVKEMIKEVYEGDQTLRDGWPTQYWAIEPFQSTRRDWMSRYSSAFRVGVNACFAWTASADVVWTKFLV